MNFRTHLAKYVNENYSTSQLPEVAIYGLKESLISQSLEILASMSKNDNSFEILHYFEKALIELNIKLPSKRSAALLYAEAILDEILEGEKEVMDGVIEIYQDALEHYNFHSEIIYYVYDSIGFEKICGLYFDYFDHIDNENIKKKIINELKPELLIWKKRLQKEKFRIHNGK